LGEALARAFLDAGACVATFSRSRTEFVKECEENPSIRERFFFREVDARNSTDVRKFATDAARQLGPIDVLINNAALAVEGVLALTSIAEIDNAIAVNLGGVVHLSAACTKSMLRNGRGTIINISSVNGVRGHQGVAVYSATKAALDGLTRSLARELGPRGIRVNSVAPGYLETDMTRGMPAERKAQIIRRTPMGRLGTVADVVSVVRFLASPDAGFITGQTIVVDGGLTC
jgi:3-oxoacyl-[acyl-carrier protein] reductase